MHTEKREKNAPTPNVAGCSSDVTTALVDFFSPRRKENLLSQVIHLPSDVKYVLYATRRLFTVEWKIK